MSFDAKKLYELLPAVYRLRDARQGEPLEALMSIIAREVDVIEEDLAQLYDDFFIETCAPWVVPYIGDLIGYRQLHGVAPAISSPRAEVANTIAYRRRKGTAAMLEQLARDVTDWPARTVEYFQRLSTTQYLNHLRPDNIVTVDLRQGELLERLDTAFDESARTADVRRIETGEGRHNIPNIGIWLWRLKAASTTRSPAVKVDDYRYMISPLGNNICLATSPLIEKEITHIAKPENVPMPISRRMFKNHPSVYYGYRKSLLLHVDGNEIDVSQIDICNLSDDGGGGWAHQPTDKYAVDPWLGRLALPFDLAHPETVEVTFHQSAVTDIGGGEYERGDSFDERVADADQPSTVIEVPDIDLNVAQAALGSANGVIEIADNGRYEVDGWVLTLDDGQRLELRAADRCRPLLKVNNEQDLNYIPDQNDKLTIACGKDSEISLNGLLIAGGHVEITGRPRRVSLRHCTLLPGRGIDVKNSEPFPATADKPSLIIDSADTEVLIDRSILGGMRVKRGLKVQVINSVIDATDSRNVAYAAIDVSDPGAELIIENSTVIGQIRTEFLRLASNSIFVAEPDAGWPAPVHSERRQGGCVRFCYVPRKSKVPRRYRCHPADENEPISVWPVFTSTRYGRPGYCQLSRQTAVEIRRGADDESEIGAFHDLYAPQREANLRLRLHEYLRFGLEAGIFYAN